MALGDVHRRPGSPPLLAVFEAEIHGEGLELNWDAIWTQALFRPCFGIPETPTVKSMSLRGLMGVVADQLTLGGERGWETVEVAFQSLLLCSGYNGPCDPRAVAPPLEDLERLIEDECSGFFDRDRGFGIVTAAIAGLKSENGAYQLRAAIGLSVYAPRAEQHPVGTLEYVAADGVDRDAVAPRLPDGRPASVYVGQRTLIFGEGHGLLPAAIDFGAAHPGCPVLSSPINLEEGENPLRISLEAAELRKLGEPDFTLKVQGKSQRPRPRISLCDIPEGEADSSWDVSFIGLRDVRGRFDLHLDSRPSRLRRSVGSGGGRLLLGLRIPAELLDVGGSRAWINVDARERLVVSTLQRIRFSIVIEDGMLLVYDWKLGKFKASWDTAPFAVERQDAFYVISRAHASLPGLGRLRLPDPGAHAFFRDGVGVSQPWCYDWLDVACRIETNGRTTGLSRSWAETQSETEVVPQEDADVFGPFVLAPSGDEA
jgi:hypothetical protein